VVELVLAVVLVTLASVLKVAVEKPLVPELETLPVNSVPLTLPALTLPVTLNDVNVPVDVMLGCAAVANVPVSNVPDTLPALTLPVTLNDVNVPTDVMFGCALVVTVAAVVADATVPLMLPAGIAESNAPEPLNVAADTLPVTLNDVNVPTDVMFGCALVVTVAAVVADATVPLMLPAGIAVSSAPEPLNVGASKF
jgi:hypothetical protein